MTKMNKMIDFGPLSLPIGDDINSLGSQTDKANPFDVEKLNNLLRDKKRNNNQIIEIEEIDISKSLIKISSFKKSDENFNLTKLSELMKLVAETVVVGTTTSVTLKINPSLLPNTTLIAKEIIQGILFEMYVKDETQRTRLIKNSNELIAYLTKQLNCIIQIHIFDPIHPLNLVFSVSSDDGEIE